MGYEGSHIYRVYIPARQKVVRSSNVRRDENSCASSRFTEGEFWNKNDSICKIPVHVSSGEDLNTPIQQESLSNSLTPFEQLSYDEHQNDEGNLQAIHDLIQDRELVGECANENRISDIEENSESYHNDVIISEETPESLPEASTNRRGRPSGRKNKVYQKVNRVTRSTAHSQKDDQATAFRSFLCASQSLLTVSDESDPMSLVEAMNGEDCIKWKMAVDTEYRSLANKKTWTLVKSSELPKGKKVLTGRLVLKTKRDKDGQILRYKALWVVR